MTFPVAAAARFSELVGSGAGACVGVDPSGELLRSWSIPDTCEGVWAFVEVMLRAADGACSIVKFQSAFFERFGSDGLRLLERAVEQARARDLLVILDCKRGDIGSTVDGYAQAFLTENARLAVDAVTATAYLGPDSLKPMLEAAESTGRIVFVVVKSSNPEGAVLQSATLPDGRTAAEYIADSLTEYNQRPARQSRFGAVGAAGAVIGATDNAVGASLAARLPTSLILVPGAGAQGGSVRHTAAAFGPAARRSIFSASRQLSSAGPAVADVRDAIRAFAEDVRSAVAAG